LHFIKPIKSKTPLAFAKGVLEILLKINPLWRQRPADHDNHQHHDRSAVWFVDELCEWIKHVE